MARSEAQIQPHNIYEIKANPTNVHWGYFSAAVKPALTVDSGDVVIIEDVPRLDPSEAERAGFAAGGKGPRSGAPHYGRAGLRQRSRAWRRA